MLSGKAVAALVAMELGSFGDQAAMLAVGKSRDDPWYNTRNAGKFLCIVRAVATCSYSHGSVYTAE